jgi:SsrA-binding protein
MSPTIHNHKARRDYFISDTYEAGIELKGTEVKSLRNARASIDDAFARIERSQAWLYNAHIAAYEQGNRYNVDSLRPRRLLLHRREINKLAGALNSKGVALIPLKIYFANGLAKIQLAVGKGKTQIDKRETIKRRTAEREIQRALRDRSKRQS